MMRRQTAIVMAVLACLVGTRPAAQGVAEPSPRAQAPRDITGQWVAIVTEDWHWRMVVPAKGDYTSLPLNAEGRRVANGWQPSRPAGDAACRAFGAAAIMRVPGRLRVSWEDDMTLKIDTDAGMQTRRFVFGRSASRGWRVNNRGEVVWSENGRDLPPPAGPRSWQGYTVARWDAAPNPETVRNAMFFAGGLGTGPEGAGTIVPGRYATLHAVTTRLRAGYLRTNGVPYSEQATVTEHFDFRTEDDGTEWFTVTTIVEDPVYLAAPFITSTDFRKESDRSKWRPVSCADY